jgi:hypothetical protein
MAGAASDMEPDLANGHGRRAEVPSTGRRRTAKSAARSSSFGKTDDDKLETTYPGSLTWNLAVLMLERQWSVTCCSLDLAIRGGKGG